MTDNLTLAYTLILLGLVLLIAELFIPTCGILTALAFGAMVVGVAMTFANDTSTGLITLVSVFLLVPVVMTAAFAYAPRTRFGKKLFLSGPQEDQTVAQMPVNLELEQLRGRYGRAASALRPAGVADFDGRRVDVLSEGALIEPGQWVRCIDVKAGRVVVRQVDRPPDLGDLDTMSLT
jgi:membrane-bound serine protease (ClpP class)